MNFPLIACFQLYVYFYYIENAQMLATADAVAGDKGK